MTDRKSHSSWMHMCVGSTYMPVHTLEQLGTFVMAWPRLRQCLLCSGEERARALSCAHTHTHANIPMDSQGWKGAEEESGPCRHSESSQSETGLHPSTTRHREHIPSPLCHTCVMLLSQETHRFTYSINGHRSDPNKYQPLLCSVHMQAPVHIYSKHMLHTLISTSSTLVPFKILCRDCFLLISKGQDMER